MRRIALIALLFAVPAPAASADEKRAESGVGKCVNDGVRLVQEDVKAETRKLGEMPPGNLSLTVLREVDGCKSATIVRHGYGLTDRGEAARAGGQTGLRR